MILSFRPIKVWPESFRPANAGRPQSPFSADYRSTLAILERELSALRARDVILQVDVDENACRLDGQLRADAKAKHPGVILSFTTGKHGALSYPCDAFTAGWRGQQQAWKENLRAVALGLEALRRVERYGIAQRGEQYAGYRELGSGIVLGPGAMTIEQAARLLVEAEDRAGDWEALLDNAEVVRFTFANAAKKHHPDVGGNPDIFRLITEARDLLLAAS